MGDILEELQAAAARKWQGDPAAQQAGLFSRAAAEIETLRARVLENAKARQPLTDAQIDAVWDDWSGTYGLRGPAGPYTRRGFARALEQAHGIWT